MINASNKIKDRFAEICEIAARDCISLERFPGYFSMKNLEVLLVVDKSGITNNGPLLEIGCGTGFQSSLLATCCDKIISTDLPDFSKTTHTIGIQNAREMALRLGISNIDYLGCSAESLPFREKSFGCVFMSSVLEHVKDKNSALTEARRVLKDDGIVVCTIPTFMESLFQFPSLYLYIAKRAFDVIRNKLFNKKVDHKSVFFSDTKKENSRNLGELASAFFRNNPSLPLPQPHGDWRNKKGELSIFVEFTQQLPWKWRKAFVNSGLEVEKTFAVLFIPYRVLEIFSPRLVTKLYSSTNFLHRSLADSFLKHFSIAMCYVARKGPRK